MAQEEKYFIKLYPQSFAKCVEKRVPWEQFILDIETAIVDNKTIVINPITKKIEVYVNNTQQTIICPVTTTVGLIHRVTSIVGISPTPSADLSNGAITVEWTKIGGAVTVHDYEIICKID